MTEKQFTQAVTDLAKTCGWRVYHTHNSRFSPAGFPDLCMVKGSRLIFAELKVGNNEPTADQLAWLMALANTHAKCYVWNPEHMLDIQRTLSLPPRR